MERYTEDQMKWFQNTEKSIENALKAVKKCREEMIGYPKLSTTSMNKFHLYVRLLEAEAQELVEEYEGRYPQCKNNCSMDDSMEHNKDKDGLTTE